MKLILNFVLLSAFYYALYKWFFARLSFFTLNRYILLLLPLLSIGIPLAAWFWPNHPIEVNNPLTASLSPLLIEASGKVQGNWAWSQILLYVYVFGLMGSLFWLGWRLYGLRVLLRKATPRRAHNITYLESKETPGPFSFLHYIVLPAKGIRQGQMQAILEHERVHCEQRHTLDNLYYNILTSLAWFNPILYLMARELRQVHECLADGEALKNTSREKYAQMLLSQMFGTEVAIPAHPFFNASLIKTRINMLYKTKTNRKMKWAYLVLIPALGLSTLYACSKTSPEEAVNTQNSEKVMDFKVAEQPPLPPHCDEKTPKEEQTACFQMALVESFTKNFKYPEQALKLGMEGRVMMQFTVNKKGKIVNAEVVRGLAYNNPDQEEAAIAVNDEAKKAISQFTELKAAEFNGTPVAVRFTLPIVLKLPEA